MSGSRLARFGMGALAFAVVVLAAPCAALANTPTLNPSGTLAFSWHGDPARGCRTAGVCDVSGTLYVIPQGQSGNFESPRTRNVDIEDDNAVVRVADPGSTAADPHICTDLEPVDMIVSIERHRAGGLRALLVPFSVVSSGHCAGPLALDLGLLTLPVRRLPGPREAYDMSGRWTFAEGPYEVTVTSTLRAQRPTGTTIPSGLGGTFGISGSGSGSSEGSGPTVKPVKALVEHVSLVYRVKPLSGKVTTTFAGRPDPMCAPFDGCGVSGTLTDAISGRPTLLAFDARRVVHTRLSSRAALGDLRAGRLPLQQTGALLQNSLAANVGWSAGSACTARLGQANALAVEARGVNDARQVQFRLTTDEVQDPFRTYCPGPTDIDVLGAVSGSSRALARSAVRFERLGATRLRVTLSGHGTFVAGSYAGARTTAVTLALRLVGLRAGTRLVKVLGPLP